MNKKIEIKNNEKIFKNKKGITLIALVITIIILLILAGIAISALTHTGIFARANDAKEKTAMSQEDESVKMAVSSALIEGEGELTTENLQDALTKSNLNGPLTGNGPWTYTGEYNKYDIEKTGNINITDNIIKTVDNYAITESGKLFKLNFNSAAEQWKEAEIEEEIPEVGKIKDIYSNYNDTWYVINSNREIYAWGNNEYGQLGIGNTENQSTPQKIEGLTNVEEIYAEDYSIYAKTTTGELYAWGNNEYGQLGIGNTENQSTPVKINGIDNIKEYEYGLLLTEKGEVYKVNQENKWKKIEGLTNAKEIYCIYSNGTIYAKTTTGEVYEVNQENKWEKIEGLTNIKELYVNYSSIYAKTTTGELYVWGNNEDGQLGIENIEYQDTPVKIENLANVEEIYIANTSIYAKTINGEVYVWGNNEDGQLGIGNTTNQSAPVKIEGLTNLEKIYLDNNRYVYAKTIYGELYTLNDKYVFEKTYINNNEEKVIFWNRLREGMSTSLVVVTDKGNVYSYMYSYLT